MQGATTSETRPTALRGAIDLRFLRILAATAALSAVLLIALRPRLALLDREPWLDEIAANLPVLMSSSFVELNLRTAFLTTPTLDLILRKYVWFPVFGHDELGLRLPSLAYSLATVVSATLITWRHFRELAGSRRALPAICAGVLAAWCAGHSFEIYYAVEARHYALLSLASLLWTASFVLRDRTKPSPAFALLSLFYLNTHFFALLPVTLAYAFDAGLLLRRREHKPALATFGAWALVVVATAAINFLPLGFLIFGPPLGHQIAHQIGERTLLVRAGEALDLWYGFFDYLGLPAAPSLVWVVFAVAVSLLAPHARAKRQGLKLALIAFVAVPALLAHARVVLDYWYHPRYHIPFFGVAAVTLILALQGLHHLASRAQDKGLPAQRATAVLAALVAASSTWHLLWLPGRLAPVPRNFSAQFRFFEAMKRSARPVFVIGNPTYAAAIDQYYWDYTGARGAFPLRFADYLSPQAVAEGFGTRLEAGSPIGEQLDVYFGQEKDAAVILHQIHAECPEDSAARLRDLPSSFRVDLLETADVARESCLFLVQGATSRADVETIARAVSFPAPSTSPLKLWTEPRGE